MTQHGRDKTGPLRDDQLKKELEGELRANRATRVEEHREPEPSAEGQPEADRAPDSALTGGTPPGMGPEDVETRSELARHLERGMYPADRDAVLEALRRHHATDRLIAIVGRLPSDVAYANVQDLARALGLGVEDHRT